jgi:hypothetical protein
MQWPETVSFPFNAGYVARERLPIRHYPHRDPVQLESRCLLRVIMMTDPTYDGRSFRRWAQGEWRTFVTSDEQPELKHWVSGTDLPLVHQTNHLRPVHVRAVQRFVHAFCLPMLDRKRPAWSDDLRPQPIPPKIVQRLEEELRYRFEV